jgi:hypothetical protein
MVDVSIFKKKGKSSQVFDRKASSMTLVEAMTPELSLVESCGGKANNQLNNSNCFNTSRGRLMLVGGDERWCMASGEILPAAKLWRS